MATEQVYKGWSSPGDDKYIPNVSVLLDKLEPGMYEPSYDTRVGYYLTKVKFSEQNIIRLPNPVSESVIKDIHNFWALEDIFLKYKFPYKRGILLYGPPGGGKSSTISLVCKEVIEAGGYVLKFNSAGAFLSNLKLLKKIQPSCKVVVLMEDLDEILYNESISVILNLLDGVEGSINNVVWLATTNRPEKLDANIKNRPSRFDRRFEFKPPTEDVRLAYLTSLFKDEDAKGYDLNMWAKSTDGLSFAHIKELFISVVMFGNNFDNVIKEIKAMKEIISSNDGE